MASPTDVVAVFMIVAIFIGIPAALAYYLWRHVTSWKISDAEECERCGYDLRASDHKCPECGGPGAKVEFHRLRRLREEWPADAIAPRQPSIDETPVIVHETFDATEAELLAQHLEVRGVAVTTADAPELSAIASHSMRGTYKLAVWSGDVEHARAIIGRLLDDPSVVAVAS